MPSNIFILLLKYLVPKIKSLSVEMPSSVLLWEQAWTDEFLPWEQAWTDELCLSTCSVEIRLSLLWPQRNCDALLPCVSWVSACLVEVLSRKKLEKIDESDISYLHGLLLIQIHDMSLRFSGFLLFLCWII